MLNIEMSRYTLFLMVFVRMTGALFFHPFLGRKNVPDIVKIGLAMLLAILLTPVLDVQAPVFPSTLAFMVALAKEMLVGYAVGYVMNLFLSFVIVAGETMDMELGLSMGRIYDPESSISMPVTGTVFNLMLTLGFFLSNGHLTYLRIMSDSCSLFPPGEMILNFQAGSYIAMMLGDMLTLALKLAMPIFAIELLSEAGMGVLMKVVPQINVFVVGLQLKLLIGLAVIILILPAVSRLMDSTMTQIFQNIQQTMAELLSAA